MIEGSGAGSMPLTNGSGSGSNRSKNIPTDPVSDPDPQLCSQVAFEASPAAEFEYRY
jgi:hypothetical protein